MSTYRIVEEIDADGNVFNYDIQARIFFIYITVGNAQTLECAQARVSRRTGIRRVVPNTGRRKGVPAKKPRFVPAWLYWRAGRRKRT